MSVAKYSLLEMFCFSVVNSCFELCILALEESFGRKLRLIIILSQVCQVQHSIAFSDFSTLRAVFTYYTNSGVLKVQW
jgi:hypothetical protein